MNERLDALLSAERDGVLDSAEAAELAVLLDAGEDVRVAARDRSEAFASVDAALRALAQRPVDDARLARSLDALRGRLAPEVVRPAFGRRAAAGLAAGLAAAIAAGLVWLSVDGLLAGAGRAPSGSPSPLPIGAADGRMAAAEESAAGASNATTANPEAGVLPAPPTVAVAVDAEDLEVIEELELLEYLVARDGRSSARRG